MKRIEIGSRRELFTDEYLIQSKTGAELLLHSPVRREIVFRINEPQDDSNMASYLGIVRDGNRWLLYYPGHHRQPTLKNPASTEGSRLCVASSSDGIHWERCKVGISKKGENVILDEEMAKKQNTNAAHSFVFKDDNPQCAPDEKFKMLTLGKYPDETNYLYMLVSEDGFRFRIKDPTPFKMESCHDSQNVLFYDHNIGMYRFFHRVRHFGERGIRTHLTKDFKIFHNSTDLVYDDNLQMAFYTNAVQPYFRAPHILMGFPMRYVDHDQTWDESYLVRPEMKRRVFWANRFGYIRVASVSTDSVFMSSRDGWHFKRFSEAFLRPGPCKDGCWTYGCNSLAAGMIPTKPALGNGAPDEISLYAREEPWEGAACTCLRRCTIRMDGFVSMHFPGNGGEFVTKPFAFDGGMLTLNIETSAYGCYSVEIQDEDGCPIPGYRMDEFFTASTDSLDAVARWKEKKNDLRELAGKTIRLRFAARDADLYSFCFVPFRKGAALPQLKVDKIQLPL